MDHDSTLTMILVSVCSTVFVFCNGSPCRHVLLTRHRPALLSVRHRVTNMTVRLVNPIDQGIPAETPVSRVPQTFVSGIDHQSDATQTPVSRVDQDSVSAADCISVSQAGFSGKQVLELWPILFGSVGGLGSVWLLPQFRRQWHAIATITSVA